MMAATATRPTEWCTPDGRIQWGSLQQGYEIEREQGEDHQCIDQRVRTGVGFEPLVQFATAVQDQPRLFAAEIFEGMSPGVLPGHFQLIEMNFHGSTSRLCCPDFANPFAQGSVQTFNLLHGVAVTMGDNFIRQMPVGSLEPEHFRLQH